MTRVAFIAALALCATLQPARSQQQSTWDIVGLRLGMTEEQVRDALRAHDPSLRLTVVEQTYDFSDGARTLKSPPFLGRIEARGFDGRGERVVVGFSFSETRGEARVIGVDRVAPRFENPPTGAQLRQQLERKYGPPHSATAGSGTALRSITWSEPGKPVCWAVNDRVTSFASAADGGSDIVGFMRKLQTKGRAPADLSTCGAAVAASMSGEPVHGLRVHMTDFGGWYVSSTNASAWVAGLQQAATKERIAKGAGPKL